MAAVSSTPFAGEGEDDVSQCEVLPEVQEMLLDEIELLVQAAFELSERLTAVQARMIEINFEKILGGVPTKQ